MAISSGTEYTIVATVLNLNKEIVRLLQKFDFTKKNPKVIYINPTEKPISLEDSIVTAFLNLVGFDVVFFVPIALFHFWKILWNAPWLDYDP